MLPHLQNIEYTFFIGTSWHKLLPEKKFGILTIFNTVQAANDLVGLLSSLIYFNPFLSLGDD